MCRANRVARFLLCGLLLLNLCPVGISSLAAAEREQVAGPDELDALSFAYRLGVDQGQSDRTSADGDPPTALAASATASILTKRSGNFTGLTIENNTHGWQREPTDVRV